MKPLAINLLSLIIALLPGWAGPIEAETIGPLHEWKFDHASPGALPSQFSIGTLFDGRPAGDWQILRTDRAKSRPNVLAQLMPKGTEHAYKVVLIKGTESANIKLEVFLLSIGGKADMGGGLIWRATDDRNYYLARANPLEQNIRIYRVVKGVRQMLSNVDRVMDTRRWHRLRVMMKGCRAQVFFDQQLVFDICDITFTGQGLVGLWTKSDAVTYFDNLRLDRP